MSHHYTKAYLLALKQLDMMGLTSFINCNILRDFVEYEFFWPEWSQSFSSLCNYLSHSILSSRTSDAIKKRPRMPEIRPTFLEKASGAESYNVIMAVATGIEPPKDENPKAVVDIASGGTKGKA
ncbi:hypothetical protein PanWU01x14_095700 [Parasponia andersonii]|uniref:Uncharacterized protein n=1 Tax=Parasponia andersonii TaxID=3476 RepID=A0A2P5D5C3_PARAD|nr:hypothetical protein PanWU01x14_095700 [Parasponia andersonii]